MLKAEIMMLSYFIEINAGRNLNFDWTQYAANPKNLLS